MNVFAVSAAALLAFSTAGADQLPDLNRLPEGVLTGLHSFMTCAQMHRIHPRGRTQYEFCGAPITWQLSRTQILQRCFRHSGISNIAVLQPGVDRKTIEYQILLDCYNANYVRIDFERLGDKVWIGQIG